jgi:two-component system sensor histidine kinase DegS
MIRITQNLAVIAATVLIIGVFSFFTFYLHQNSERAVLSQFEQHQLVHVQHISNKIESYFWDQVSALRAISSSPSFQYGDLAEKAGDIRAYFQQGRNSPVSAISISDPTGNVIYSTEKRMIGVKYGQQEFFIQAKKQENRNKSFVNPISKHGKFEKSKQADFRFLLMIPVYQETYVLQGPEPSGKFIGTISLVVDLGKFISDPLNYLDPDPDIDQLWIIDEGGTLLFHSAHREMVPRNFQQRERKCNECHISFEHVKRILKERQGTVKYQLRKFPARMAAFAPMKFENLSWIVVMNSSYDKMTAFARKSLWGHMALLAVLGFTFIVGVTVIRRKLKSEDEARLLREKMAVQQKGEEALRKSEEKYRGLVETMTEGLVMIDQNGLFTFANQRFCEIFGYSREEIIGQPIREFLDPATQKILDEQMEQRRKGAHEAYEVCWTRKDGQKIIGRVSPQIILDEKGQVQGSFAVIMDITERKRYEEAFWESERQLRSLPAQLMTAQETERKRISRELHDELGQDLNVLKMRVGFIKRKLEEKQFDLGEECETTIHYITQIIESVRRISQDLSPSILEDFGLEAALRWLTGHFSRNCGIPVSLDLGKLNLSFPVEVQILIYRIVQEALNNVGKHARATEVWVAASESAGILSFRVRDNGRGFDLKQVIQAKSDEGGLGLAAMKERARMLGGRLEIKSLQREGTSVILSFPFPGGAGR